MADLNETQEWVSGIRQLEVTDPAQGGEGGIMNRQAEQLAARAQYLRRRQLVSVLDITFTSASYALAVFSALDEFIRAAFAAGLVTIAVMPTQDPEGSFGEAWIEDVGDAWKIHRTGEYEGPARVTVLGTLNDSWE